MPDKFQMGEIVIIQNSDYYLEHDGAPAVVIGPCFLRLAMDLRVMKRRYAHTYSVRVLVDPPRCVCTRPDQMRKLHDDPEDHVTECEKEREPAVPICRE
jgi:hypothetical protein